MSHESRENVYIIRVHIYVYRTGLSVIDLSRVHVVAVVVVVKCTLFL